MSSSSVIRFPDLMAQWIVYRTVAEKDVKEDGVFSKLERNPTELEQSVMRYVKEDSEKVTIPDPSTRKVVDCIIRLGKWIKQKLSYESGNLPEVSFQSFRPIQEVDLESQLSAQIDKIEEIYNLFTKGSYVRDCKRSREDSVSQKIGLQKKKDDAEGSIIQIEQNIQKQINSKIKDLEYYRKSLTSSNPIISDPSLKALFDRSIDIYTQLIDIVQSSNPRNNDFICFSDFDVDGVQEEVFGLIAEIRKKFAKSHRNRVFFDELKKLEKIFLAFLDDFIPDMNNLQNSYCKISNRIDRLKKAIEEVLDDECKESIEDVKRNFLYDMLKEYEDDCHFQMDELSDEEESVNLPKMGGATLDVLPELSSDLEPKEIFQPRNLSTENSLPDICLAGIPKFQSIVREKDRSPELQGLNRSVSLVSTDCPSVSASSGRASATSPGLFLSRESLLPSVLSGLFKQSSPSFLPNPQTGAPFQSLVQNSSEEACFEVGAPPKTQHIHSFFPNSNQHLKLRNSPTQGNSHPESDDDEDVLKSVDSELPANSDGEDSDGCFF